MMTDIKHSKLAIIAGQGSLPAMIIDAARNTYNDLFVIAFHGETAEHITKNLEHCWLNIEEIARTLELCHKHQVSHIVMAGKLTRPTLHKLTPKILAAKIVSRLGKALFAGDDALFRAITSIFEQEGFCVVGVDDLLEELLTPQGILTNAAPSQQTLEDINIAIPIIRTIGELDIGQSLVIKNGIILGVEAAEGTDALIARCANLHDKEETGGVLVKACKPKQERRVDLPAIGPNTIKEIVKSGLAGIAIESGASLIIERKKVVELANSNNIFIKGF